MHILSALILAGGVQVAAAQAAIDGRVLDQHNAVLIGATVRVTSAALAEPRILTTDNRGKFQLSGLAAGTYELTLTMPAFRAMRTQVTLGASEQQAIDFRLEVGRIEMTVNVVAPAPAAVAKPDPIAKPAPAAETKGITPIRVGGAIKEPQRIRYVVPAYPPEAIAARVTGSVFIEAIVATDGTVKEVKALQGPSELIDAALAAVKEWRYTPTLLNGQPVEVAMTVYVNFQLR